MANDALKISGEVRVEYDNWLSRDKASVDALGQIQDESRTERLYMERAVLKAVADPGGNTTATLMMRCDDDTGRNTNATRNRFYVYNAYVNHSMMNNMLSLTMGKFNIHVPQVYGIRGPNTYAYAYFTKEKKNGIMATLKPIDPLKIDLAIIDEHDNNDSALEQTDSAKRPYNVYLKGSYKVIDILDVYLLAESMSRYDASDDPADDMLVSLGAKLNVNNIEATLEIYQEMIDSKEDTDTSFMERQVINLGASIDIANTIKPYLALELIDDGNDFDDGHPTMNIVLGAHWKVADNLTYAVEIDNTSFEDDKGGGVKKSMDTQTKIGLRARLTF